MMRIGPRSSVSKMKELKWNLESFLPAVLDGEVCPRVASKKSEGESEEMSSVSFSNLKRLSRVHRPNLRFRWSLLLESLDR